MIRKDSAMKWLQYILIYLVITQIGGMAATIVGGVEAFLFVCLVASVIGYYFIGLKVDSSYHFAMILIAAIMLFNVLRTGGDLSIGTTLNILSKYLLLYAAVKVDSSEFLPRFLKVSYLLMLLSVIQFTIVLIFGVGAVLPLFSRLWHAGPRMGGFFLGFVTNHPGRNCGIFGEPGQYQAFLTTVLYFLLFRSDFYDKEKYRLKYFVMTILAIFSCQSTSGFLGMVATITVYLIATRNKDAYDIVFKRVMIASVVVGIVMMLFIVDKDSGLYYNFIGKILGTNGINLNQASAGARINSIEGVYNVLKENPHLIWGAGYEAMYTYNLDGCASLPILLLAVGAPCFCLIYGHMLVVGNAYRKSVADVIVRVFLVVNVGLGQPNILFISFLMMMYYDYLVRDIQRA